MIRKLFQTMHQAVDPDALMALTEEIYATDRHFTYPKFRETANRIARKLKEWGCDAQVMNGPADGKSIIGTWKMPVAWDCSSARLEVTGPAGIRGEVLSERPETMTAVVQYSGPTPPEGLEGELVEVHTGMDFRKVVETGQAKGRFLFTSQPATAMRKRAQDAGMLGVISCHTKKPELNPQAICWANSWCNRAGGWAATEDDTPFPGMMISPAQGERLKIWLQGGPVRVRMTIDAKVYAGQLPIASGGIRAQEGTKEEVLVFGHAYEQGADDNASGVAVSVDSIRVIQSLVQSGALPAPKRGIRTITPSECYGTLAYMARSKQSLKRTVAALNWDCVGVHQEKNGMPFPVHVNPLCTAGFSDTLILELFRCLSHLKYNPYFSWHEAGYYMGDTFLMDPEFNVPLVYGGGIDNQWHTSADTMDRLDPAIMRLVTAASAAFCYFLASAGPSEARWLAEETAVRWTGLLQKAVSEAVQAITDPQHVYVRFGPHFGPAKGPGESSLPKRYADIPPAEAMGQVLDHLDFLKGVAVRAVQSVNRLLSPEERKTLRKELKALCNGLERLVREESKRIRKLAPNVEPVLPTSPEREQAAALGKPHKTFFGPPAFDNVPEDVLASAETTLGRWDTTLQIALFWSNGKHPLDAIIRWTEYERGGNHALALVQAFTFLAKHGMIEFK